MALVQGHAQLAMMPYKASAWTPAPPASRFQTVRRSVCLCLVLPNLDRDVWTHCNDPRGHNRSNQSGGWSSRGEKEEGGNRFARAGRSQLQHDGKARPGDTRGGGGAVQLLPYDWTFFLLDLLTVYKTYCRENMKNSSAMYLLSKLHHIT